MPTSATARTRPKVNTDPPSSGASRRYQTISRRKKAKPTVADAVSRNAIGAARAERAEGAGWAGGGGVAGRAGGAGTVIGLTVSGTDPGTDPDTDPDTDPGTDPD